ncbi:MAG: flippase-like domain-containing protein [Flavobacteriales bacterium]|nr:flippase-like domain-containing protein [Flavobacteriales bacterium]
MRKALISGLRMAIPIALGIWLVLYFYRQLDEGQRAELFTAFREANWWWLGLSIVLSLASHISRAWRWRYLLSPLGHRVSFWNAFNAVMSGYFMNLLIQRAGEVSRAVMLGRMEQVPFEKGFGTILGERAVDMGMLLGIAALTVLLQLDKLDLFQDRIAAFRAGQGDPAEAATGWPWWSIVVIIVILMAIITGVYLLLTRPALRGRLKQTVRGFYEGVAAIFRTPHKTAFLFHTVLIWVLYIAMFWVGFLALPGTQAVPFAGVMAGFIAGSVGIVLVQGGIGVYPAFVALIVSVYMPAPEGAGLLRPDALAMGWLIWVAQTLMTIVVGGLSLLLISRSGKPQAV